MSRARRFLLSIVVALLAVTAIRWPVPVASDSIGQAEARLGTGQSGIGSLRSEKIDDDADGIDDAIEDALAEKFAPVVYHGEKEVAFPVTVDWWLARTRLSFYDDAGSPRARRVRDGPLRQDMLLDGAGGQPTSGTRSPVARSRLKNVTFFLDNVVPAFRRGVDSGEWVTYVHSYRNGRGGVTLQYWRPYTWNDSRLAGVDFSHGGDWEAVAVQLDAALQPDTVRYLQHAGSASYREGVPWEATHPVVYSEEGSHSSAPDRRNLSSARMIRQETWTGGETTWFTGERRASGGLMNVGEKSHPRNRQVFVQYAGIWGEPTRFFITSGYWGPAFNETGAACEDGVAAYRFVFGFAASRRSCGRILMNAWCDGMASGPLDLERECYATQETP
jgi:hypothetical protein